MLTTPVYINPLTDFGFKYIFGREENKDLLISFLNSLFPENGEIVDVTFVDKENGGESKDSRALIYDIHCLTADGKKFIVEMQNRYQTHFRDRALYYLSADIYTQGKKGKDWNYSLTPVYGVFLMNFDWKEFEDEQLREDVGLVNIRTGKQFSDRLRMVFLKIPMLTKDEKECKESLERWLYIFKNMETMERIPSSFTSDPIFRKLGKIARIGALSEAQRRAYDNSLKIYRDNYAIAETERNEGIAEGYIKGRAEEKRTMALGLLNAGVDMKVITSVTGFTTEQLAKLRQEM
ncbi:MAG: Rpn family recombination-promoting nuclease/putative transposase [Muribaculaceae bacterium]|nr:Rpn family recombination-promoting nuclease/putative transposase [Muribaculaceae bacterium]